MRRALISGAARFAAIAGFLLLLWMSAPVTTQSTAAGAASVPAFLQAGRCYRFTFPITGAPNWKVLEVLDAGWIKAEVDVGAGVGPPRTGLGQHGADHHRSRGPVFRISASPVDPLLNVVRALARPELDDTEVGEAVLR